MSESITVLRCARGLRLAKLIRPAKIVTYDSTRTYDGWTVSISSIADVKALISEIINKPRLCVVRGQLIGGKKVQGIRRLLYHDCETGDEPTLADVPRLWVALDVEGIPRPLQIEAADLAGCAKDALRHFPRVFRQATCVIQATAGHGIKPDMRLRLWFWLSRPTSGAELKRWLKGCPADQSIFSAAQVIYTAAPVFEGREDHLSNRIAVLNGEPAVMVPSEEALAPPLRSEQVIPQASAPGANAYAWTVLRNAVARVGNASVDSRHPTCLAQSLRLGRLVSAGILGAGEVKEAMGKALAGAGKTKEEGEALAGWAIAQVSGGAR